MKKDVKRKVTRRLKLIEGQVRGLQRMVDREKYCVDIITQTSAVRQALSVIEDLMLENHLSTHVVEQMKGKNQRKATDEILKIYKLAKKNGG